MCFANLDTMQEPPLKPMPPTAPRPQASVPVVPMPPKQQMLPPRG